MQFHTGLIRLTPVWRDYYGLCKIRVVAVLLLTAVVGMLLATPQLPNLVNVIIATFGIGLCASSAAAFNHVLDRRFDALMYRTKKRPLPTGRVGTQQAIVFATCLGCVGFIILYALINPLTAYLTLMSLIGYAVIYTAFLKRATPQNITIGGLAGAMPPLLGWTAMTDTLEANSLLLVLIIFAWTPPHFWALAIHKRQDYAKAQIPMLPVTHGVQFTKLQILLYSLLMTATTALPYVVNMSGLIYLFAIFTLNCRFMYFVLRLFSSDESVPLSLFWFSIRYIMWLFFWLLIDHYISL